MINPKKYQLTNHLGNVLEVVTDRKLQRETAEGSGILDYYTADVVSQSDYFPFGMMLPNRNESGDEYRYGFNGMEKDDEVSGEANSYDFGARFYNPRVGRFLSIDPKDTKFPFMTPYCFAANSPLYYIDSDGEEAQPSGKYLIMRWVEDVMNFDMSKNDDPKYIADWADETTENWKQVTEDQWEDFKKDFQNSPLLMGLTALMAAPLIELVGTSALTSSIVDAEVSLITSEAGKQVLKSKATFLIKGYSGSFAINLTTNFMQDGLSDPVNTITRSFIEIDIADAFSGGIPNKAIGILLAAGIDASIKDGIVLIAIDGEAGKSKVDAAIDIMLDTFFGAMGSDVNVKWSSVWKKVADQGKKAAAEEAKKLAGDEAKELLNGNDNSTEQSDDENTDTDTKTD